MYFCLLPEIWVKELNENLSSKYNQKLLIHSKQSATNVLKTASKKIFKNQQKQLLI